MSETPSWMRICSCLMLAVAACGSPKGRDTSDAPPPPPPTPDAPGPDASPPGQTIKIIPTSADLDILLVMDDSPSTKDKQDVFAANIPALVKALDAFPGGRPSVHIGVVSSTVDIHTNNFGVGCPSPNLAEDGRLQSTARIAGCTPPTGRYIEDVKNPDGSRKINYTGKLDEALACIAELGASGCGFEAQLEGMKRALDDSHPENAGFLRPSAYLAVIILTDEDDASVKDNALFNLDMAQVGPGDFRAQPLNAYTCDTPISLTAGSYTNCKVKEDGYLQSPSFYHDFLTAKKAPGQVVVAVIGGSLDNPQNLITCNAAAGSCDIKTGEITQPFSQTLALEPSCSATINGNFQIARPGLRLDKFVKSFGSHGLFETVCQPDYSKALTDIGDLLFRSVSPCLDGNIDPNDTDPTNPGVQPACTVSDVANLNTAQEQQTVLPACKMTAAGTPDPASTRPCWWMKTNPTCGTAPHLELHVERTSSPAAGTNVEVRCAIQ